MTRWRRLAIVGVLLAPLPLDVREVEPAPAWKVQQDALERLRRSGDWHVRWDEETGSPATLEERRLAPGGAYRRGRPFSPESVASAFVRRHAGLFPLRPGLDSLAVVQADAPPRHPRRGRSHTVRMTQLYRGLPVEHGDYAITMTPDGQPVFVNGRFHREVAVDPRPALDPGDAVRLAREEVGAGADSVEAAPRLAVKRKGGRDHLVWEITVPEDPLRIWRVQVDAHDGRVVGRANRVIVDPR